MCSSTDKEAGRPADGFSEPPFDGDVPADTPAARVALKVPHPESLVEVRLTPPDSRFEVKVSPDGQTVELLIHPGAGLISLRLSPPEEAPPKAAAREPGPGPGRPREPGLRERGPAGEAAPAPALAEFAAPVPALAEFTVPAEDVLRLLMVHPATAPNGRFSDDQAISAREPMREARFHEAKLLTAKDDQGSYIGRKADERGAVSRSETTEPSALAAGPGPGEADDGPPPEIPPPEALGGPAEAEFTGPAEDILHLVMVQPGAEEADDFPPPEVLGGPASEAEPRQPPDAGPEEAGPTAPDDPEPAEPPAALEAAATPEAAEPDERPAEADAAPDESAAEAESPPADDQEAAPLGELYARDPDLGVEPPEDAPSAVPPAAVNDHRGAASFKGLSPYDPDFDEEPPGGLFSASPLAAAGGKAVAGSEELEEILPIEEEAAGLADGAPARLPAAVQDEPVRLELAEVGRRPAAPPDEGEPAPPEDGPDDGSRPARGAR